MATARATALLVAAALVLPGCEDGEKQASSAPAKQPPATTPAKRARKRPRHQQSPRYYPSAHHSHRPPGYIYPDEVGENVLIAPYRRVIEVFGPPATRHGKCIRYRIVHFPRERWEFCFRGQKMTGAMVARPHG